MRADTSEVWETHGARKFDMLPELTNATANDGSIDSQNQSLVTGIYVYVTHSLAAIQPYKGGTYLQLS